LIEVKVVIFGTGRYYSRYKESFRKNVEVVAFLDNNPPSETLDGVRVYKPEEIVSLEYDIVFLLSVHENEMREQLKELGVPALRIYGMEQIEKICEMGETVHYGDALAGKGRRNVLMFSPAMSSTGAQNVLFITACELVKKGYAVTVVSKTDGILRERLVNEEIPVVITKEICCDSAEIKSLVEWSDVVLVNTYWIYYIVLELCTYEKEIIWWLHELGGIPQMDSGVMRYILGRGNVKAYAVSNVVKNAVESVSGICGKVGLLTFGIPEYDLKDNRHKGVTVFAIIGGIGYIKGQDIFVDAVAKLSKEYRESAEFWIVGGGMLPADVLDKACKYGCIKIIGEIDNRRIKDVYSKIDVVVCCSREEQMSVSVIEGFMNRKVAIVSEVAGIAEVIKDNVNGFIMKNEDSDGLARIMMHIIDSNQEMLESIGIEARKTFDELFSVDTFDNRLDEVFG
jgi:glycosyltransferase involved in cell wall biosynthesis